jgi:two-component system, NarL family, invasion response regulator UvrY
MSSDLKYQAMKKILIVDDHEVLREGVKKLFNDRDGETIFGEAGTAQEALRLVTEQDWDLAVLDLSLGGRGGLDVLKELKRIRPRVPVLIFSMHSEEPYVRRALKAGVSGYVIKTSPRGELMKAIETVIGGGKYVSSALTETLITSFERDTDQLPHELLSDREFEVMRLIASGKNGARDCRSPFAQR